MSDSERILHPDEQDGVEVEHVVEHVVEGSNNMFYFINSKAVDDYFWMLFDPEELL